MIERKLVPNIRFKSCKNEWKINRFKDLFNHKSGTAIESFFNENGKYKVISIGSYSKNSKYIDQGIRVDLNPVTKSQIVNKNDLTMVLNDKTKDGQIIGRVLLVDKNDEYVINQRTERLIPKCIDSNFAFVYLNGPFRKVVKRMVQGGTQIYINYSAIEEQNVIVPKGLKEEVKLGNLFAKLDRLLDLQQQKLDQLELLKKVLLQKLFPKQDAKIPELRFKGFEDEWKTKQMDTFVNRLDNQRAPVTASKRIPGITPYYGANGIQDFVKGYTHQGEFVLIAEDGANDLHDYPVKYVSGKIWVNNHAHVIQAKPDLADNVFVSYAFKNKKIEPYLVGGGRAKLNAEVLMKMNLKLPALPEQQKIGNLLAKIDRLIELENKKFDNLKQVKKSLLQNMFVE